MRRATPPIEILLGFAAGMLATFFVLEPLVWFLHHFGLTARQAFSTVLTAPFGVQALWSRVFWGGVYGVVLAWFATRYPLGVRSLVASALFTIVVRTVADWFVVPMFWGHAWAGWSADAIVTPLVLNVVWGVTTAVVTAALTLAAGTFGPRSPV